MKKKHDPHLKVGGSKNQHWRDFIVRGMIKRTCRKKWNSWLGTSLKNKDADRSTGIGIVSIGWYKKNSHGALGRNAYNLTTIVAFASRMSLLVSSLVHIRVDKHHFHVISARSWHKLVPMVAMLNGHQDMMLKNMVAKLRFKAMTKTNNWRCCTKSWKKINNSPLFKCIFCRCFYSKANVIAVYYFCFVNGYDYDYELFPFDRVILN